MLISRRSGQPGIPMGRLSNSITLATRYTLTDFLNNMADVEIDIPAISGMCSPEHTTTRGK